MMRNIMHTKLIIVLIICLIFSLYIYSKILVRYVQVIHI